MTSSSAIHPLPCSVLIFQEAPGWLRAATPSKGAPGHVSESEGPVDKIGRSQIVSRRHATMPATDHRNSAQNRSYTLVSASGGRVELCPHPFDRFCCDRRHGLVRDCRRASLLRMAHCAAMESSHTMEDIRSWADDSGWTAKLTLTGAVLLSGPFRVQPDGTAAYGGYSTTGSFDVAMRSLR